MLAIYFLNTWTFLAAILLVLGVVGYFIYQLVREITPTISLIKEFTTDINQTVAESNEIIPIVQSISQNLSIQMQEFQEIKQLALASMENIKQIKGGVSDLRSKNAMLAIRYGKAQLLKVRKGRFKVSQSILQKKVKSMKLWLSRVISRWTNKKISPEDIGIPIRKLGKLLRQPAKKLQNDSPKFSWKDPLIFAGGGVLGAAAVSFWGSRRALEEPQPELESEVFYEDQDYQDFIRNSSYRRMENNMPEEDWDRQELPFDKKTLDKSSPHRDLPERLGIKNIPALFMEAFREWSKDKAPRLGAALSYYTVFSLAPTLVVVIAVAGIVFGTEAVQDRIIFQIQSLIGKNGADAVRQMLIVAQQPKVGFIATIVGVITLLLGASGVFGELQDSMNTIWGIQPKETGGILGMIRQRFTSFAMVLGIGFLLLASLVISAGIAAVGEYMGNIFGVPEGLLQILNFVFSFILITLLFALMFKVVPDAKVAWHDVWIGAAVTSLLFSLGKLAIGIYLGKSDVTTAFGAAGSLVLILVWVYYSAQIIFFGAEFTKVYANRYGSKIRPEKPEPV